MGQIKIVLPDGVEQAFRKAAMERFMYQKGAVSRAAKIAIEQWSKNHNEGRRKEVNWTILRGVLKHVKKTSVELQHEAWDSIVKKNVNR